MALTTKENRKWETLIANIMKKLDVRELLVLAKQLEDKE